MKNENEKIKNKNEENKAKDYTDEGLAIRSRYGSVSWCNIWKYNR